MSTATYYDGWNAGYLKLPRQNPYAKGWATNWEAHGAEDWDKGYEAGTAQTKRDNEKREELSRALEHARQRLRELGEKSWLSGKP